MQIDSTSVNTASNEQTASTTNLVIKTQLDDTTDSTGEAKKFKKLKEKYEDNKIRI